MPKRTDNAIPGVDWKTLKTVRGPATRVPRSRHSPGGRLTGCPNGHASGGGVTAMCYIAIMRAGRTKTTSFSLDDATLSNLKALASRRHKGNVSALLAEIASREAKFAAAEAYFEKYSVPPLHDEAVERIEAEWRGEAPPKKSRRRAA